MIILRYYHDLKFKDIAKIMESSVCHKVQDE
ncbi:MAG: hypothetical protein ACLRPW_08440 [Intestinibacter sp.]